MKKTEKLSMRQLIKCMIKVNEVVLLMFFSLIIGLIIFMYLCKYARLGHTG